MLAAGLPVWGAEGGPIAWVGWTDEAWAKAKAEKRLVLLDLEAVWCHWCHVMDKTTYIDPKVAGILEKRYVAVKVDQDARPDIAATTKITAGRRRSCSTRRAGRSRSGRGYMPPERMAGWLRRSWRSASGAVGVERAEGSGDVCGRRRSPKSCWRELRQRPLGQLRRRSMAAGGRSISTCKATPVEWSMREAARRRCAGVADGAEDAGRQR